MKAREFRRGRPDHRYSKARRVVAVYPGRYFSVDDLAAAYPVTDPAAVGHESSLTPPSQMDRPTSTRCPLLWRSQ